LSWFYGASQRKRRSGINEDTSFLHWCEINICLNYKSCILAHVNSHCFS
jgi:hypothetical protein